MAVNVLTWARQGVPMSLMFCESTLIETDRTILTEASQTDYMTHFTRENQNRRSVETERPII